MRGIDKETSRHEPVIQLGTRGPRGESGFLLRAASDEKLSWDLEHEIVSARRVRRAELGGWWIASSYFDTAVDIVLRVFESVRVVYPDGGETRVLYADDEPAPRRAP